MYVCTYANKYSQYGTVCSLQFEEGLLVLPGQFVLGLAPVLTSHSYILSSYYYYETILSTCHDVTVCSGGGKTRSARFPPPPITVF